MIGCMKRKRNLCMNSRFRLTQIKISYVNLRRLVNKILIHQNKDKNLNIKFKMNVDFNNSNFVFTESEIEV